MLSYQTGEGLFKRNNIIIGSNYNFKRWMSKFKRVWYFQKGFNWMLNENQNVVHLLSFLFSEKKKINSYNNETKIKAMDIKSMEWIIRLLTINSIYY